MIKPWMLTGINLFLISIMAGFAYADVPEGASSPNLLFIYVEDLGYYTSERFAREPKTMITGLQTPNLDRLASQSVVFTRAFCGQSVCSPSKGAIYSGLAPHANGIWRNVFNHAAPGRIGPEHWIPLPSSLTPQNDPSNTGVGGLHEDIPTLVQKLKTGGVYSVLVLHCAQYKHDGGLEQSPGECMHAWAKRGDRWVHVGRQSTRFEAH